MHKQTDDLMQRGDVHDHGSWQFQQRKHCPYEPSLNALTLDAVQQQAAGQTPFEWHPAEDPDRTR